MSQTNEYGLFPSEDLRGNTSICTKRSAKREGDGAFAIWRIFDVTDGL
jgi:hypothetical protein